MLFTRLAHHRRFMFFPYQNLVSSCPRNDRASRSHAMTFWLVSFDYFARIFVIGRHIDRRALHSADTYH
jgi:hypothetical protein